MHLHKFRQCTVETLWFFWNWSSCVIFSVVKISQVVYYALVNLQTRNIPKRKCKSDQYPLIAFMIGHISSCSCCCTGTIWFNQSLSAPAIIWCKIIFPSQRPLCLCTCALSSCPAPTRWAWGDRVPIWLWKPHFKKPTSSSKWAGEPD